VSMRCVWRRRGEAGYATRRQVSVNADAPGWRRAAKSIIKRDVTGRVSVSAWTMREGDKIFVVDDHVSSYVYSFAVGHAIV
jgi:predicted phosphoadenosine phosphosulfate sulfurtransferase